MKGGRLKKKLQFYAKKNGAFICDFIILYYDSDLNPHIIILVKCMLLFIYALLMAHFSW